MTTFARYLWLLVAAIALPAWAHWPYVVGEIDLASVEVMTPTRFLCELVLSASFVFALFVLPWSLLLRRRQRRRGVLPRDAWIAATAMAVATLLGLHANMTGYAPFYGNTWALWEPTFELFLPHGPSVLAILALAIALEAIGAKRSARTAVVAAPSGQP